MKLYVNARGEVRCPDCRSVEVGVVVVEERSVVVPEHLWGANEGRRWFDPRQTRPCVRGGESFKATGPGVVPISARVRVPWDAREKPSWHQVLHAVGEEGGSLEEVRARSGLWASEFEVAWNMARARGLIDRVDGRLVPTPQGRVARQREGAAAELVAWNAGSAAAQGVAGPLTQPDWQAEGRALPDLPKDAKRTSGRSIGFVSGCATRKLHGIQDARFDTTVPNGDKLHVKTTTRWRRVTVHRSPRASKS